MYRILLSLLLIGSISTGVAEDAPLPLDHVDAMTFYEESVPAAYQSRKKEKKINKSPAKKEKFSTSRGRQGRSRDSDRTMPRKNKKPSSRAKVLNMTKVQKKRRIK